MGKYTAGVRNVAGSAVPVAPQPVMQTQVPQAAVFIQGQEPLTASMLAAAPPNEQKQMLGERLFPLIQSMHQNWLAKLLVCYWRLTTQNWCICWNTKNHSRA